MALACSLFVTDKNGVAVSSNPLSAITVAEGFGWLDGFPDSLATRQVVATIYLRRAWRSSYWYFLESPGASSRSPSRRILSYVPCVIRASSHGSWLQTTYLSISFLQPGSRLQSALYSSVRKHHRSERIDQHTDGAMYIYLLIIYVENQMKTILWEPSQSRKTRTRDSRIL